MDTAGEVNAMQPAHWVTIGAVHMPATQAHPRRTAQDIGKATHILEGLVHRAHAGHERGMVHEQQGRDAGPGRERPLQPVRYGFRAVPECEPGCMVSSMTRRTGPSSTA